MRKIKIDKFIVANIVNDSENLPDALVELYKLAINIDWDNIEKIKHPIVSRNTAIMIMDIITEKYDRVTANMLWLNKGFSSKDDVQDNYIYINDNMIVMKSTDPITEMFAQKEVEEFGEPIDPDIFHE